MFDETLLDLNPKPKKYFDLFQIFLSENTVTMRKRCLRKFRFRICFGLIFFGSGSGQSQSGTKENGDGEGQTYSSLIALIHTASNCNIQQAAKNTIGYYFKSDRKDANALVIAVVGSYLYPRLFLPFFPPPFHLQFTSFALSLFRSLPFFLSFFL